MSILELRINKDISNKYRKDTVLYLEKAKDGLPKDIFWRNRIKDAVIDNCVTILTNKKPAKNKGDKK